MSRPEPKSVPGVDLQLLTDWMDGRGLGAGPIDAVRVIEGGTQNIMLRLSRDGREFVLRRGPLHLRPRTNTVLRREMRLLGALSETRVPHARLIAACGDESVLNGSAFYLMEPLDGFNAGTHLPALHAGSEVVRYQMGLALVDALAELGRVDYAAVGLNDFGHPDGFLERQVPRWTAELHTYADLKGYPGNDLPVGSVGDWLVRHMPNAGRVGIMHGDYHVFNVMFESTGHVVAAIVDWEMCTVGDPLLDLGWLLATWPDPGDPHDVLDSALSRASGLPPRDVIIERYAERTGWDVSAADWYAVMACFKLGILLEGTYARSCAGLAEPDVGQRLHRTATVLFHRARTVIGA